MTNSQRMEQPTLQSVNHGREYRQVSTASAPREREPVVVSQGTVTNKAASAPRQKESALTLQTSATIQAGTLYTKYNLLYLSTLFHKNNIMCPITSDDLPNIDCKVMQSFYSARNV